MCGWFRRAPGKDEGLSSDREAEKSAFLQTYGFGDARREPLSGDASTRAYERLFRADGASFIFMDQPPHAETQPCPPDATADERRASGYNALARLAAGRVDAFVATAGWLREAGLSAPAILAADAPRGLAVLEDLGDDLFARLIDDGQAEGPLYDDAIAALVRLHEVEPPSVLQFDGATWPLLTYDDLAYETAQNLFPEWLPKLKPQLLFDAQALTAWEAIWAPIRKRGEAGAAVFCHRDYHAENLIWLPQRSGAQRVGLLDFQDALKAHPAWDLSMLLHDARRDVSAELEAAALDRYFALRPHVDRAAMLADYHALGALNIVRILGIFARLVTRDGKPRYAAFMPRLWGYLDRCLADPQLAPLKTWVDAYVPVEARN
jgi:aminoglycoside/choline kinase family phosphotransferase